MAFKIFFKELNESLQGEFQKRIRQAKKGECAGIMKELEAAFKDHKINQNEFDMLTAMTGRKMDKLDEASSVQDYVNDRLESELRKDGFNLPKNGPTKKMGYSVWSFMDGYEIVNDGVGIKIKKDGKEVKYFDKPKLSYKDAVEFLSNAIMNESKKVQPKDFKKGDKVSWASAFGSHEQDMEGEVIGFKDHEDYKNGYLIIKGSDKKEYKKIFSGVTKLNEETEETEETELAEGDVELKVGSSCAYKGTKCKVLKTRGGNKYEIEYKGKPLNVKMQGMTLVTESEELDEAIEGINNTGIGYVISYSMFMIAQTHIWHLLCKSGQKHVALKNFYDELQDEVDELAERFIAQGGILSDVEANLVARYDDFEIVSAFNSYREMVTSCVESRPEMASIVDGIVDLQEVIDSNLYKFNLN